MICVEEQLIFKKLVVQVSGSIILAGTQFERFFLITEEGANSAQRAQRQNTHLPGSIEYYL